MGDTTAPTQDTLIKLYSLRVSELSSILSQFGYGVRNQSKGALQSTVRDSLLRNPQPAVRQAASALVLSFYTRRFGPPANRNPVASAAPPMPRPPPGGGYAASATSGGTFRVQQAPASNTMSRSANAVGHSSAQSSNSFNAITAQLNAEIQRVKFTEQPFYDRDTSLVQPTALVGHGSSGMQTTQVRFLIPRSFMTMLVGREDAPLPRYEVQLRMGVLDGSREQPDDFPKNLRGSINGVPISFPPYLNLPARPGTNVEQKRHSKPVNVTQQCLPYREQPYVMNLEWQQERTTFFVTVNIVNHLTSENLRDRLVNCRKVVYEETRQMIRKMLRGNEEDDIAMDKLRVSLICPLSRTKMTFPSRSKNCTHLQCFDLYNFLQMMEKRPTWKCPVCAQSCLYSSLVVDNYFKEIISKVGGKAKEVELLTDGGWRMVDEEKPEVFGLNDTKPASQSTKKAAAKPVEVNGSASTSSAAATPMSASAIKRSPPPSVSAPEPASANVPDVITLSDSSDESSSDDDEPPPASLSQNSRKRALEPPRGSGDPRVITLDSDTDEEEEVPPKKTNTPGTAAGTPALQLPPMPFLHGPTENVTEIFDAKSVEDCAATAEIAIQLYNFLQQIQLNNGAQPTSSS
ncbi:hypothetical protein M3Y99_00721500 [Aphelenchoides fujianensis]|nr:hypothetical protein M3Y99_00721500 [Aphelenchoides fujianensis]